MIIIIIVVVFNTGLARLTRFIIEVVIVGVTEDALDLVIAAIVLTPHDNTVLVTWRLMAFALLSVAVEIFCLVAFNVDAVVHPTINLATHGITIIHLANSGGFGHC